MRKAFSQFIVRTGEQSRIRHVYKDEKSLFIYHICLQFQCTDIQDDVE